MSEIASVSIPTHSTSSAGGLHVIYGINLEDKSGNKWTVWKRYTEFSALHDALSKKAALPEPFPPRRHLLEQEFGHIQNPFFAFLDDEFLKARRTGLESYLRGILESRDHDLWDDTDDWKNFFAQPKPEEKIQQPISSKAKGTPYKGVNSYYLHTFPENDRIKILDALKNNGFTVIRVFVSHILANNKGSPNSEVPDLEPKKVREYDDTVLQKIDQLMLEASDRGIKLIIGLHTRYSLGWWATDIYATTYGVASPGSSGAQRITDATKFYRNNDAKKSIDLRIDHILQHKNAKMGNKRWGALGKAVFAFEPQNEPFGYMDVVEKYWIRDRCGRIKENLDPDSGILVSNGGGVSISTSLTDDMINNKNLDIVCVHDYGTNPWSSVPNVAKALDKVKAAGKTLLFEEWGGKGGNKADIVYAYVEALYDYNIAWCYWEVTIPGKGANDFEIAPGDNAWNALTHKPTGTRRESEEDGDAQPEPAA